jgi:microcystin-dependent protein
LYAQNKNLAVRPFWHWVGRSWIFDVNYHKKTIFNFKLNHSLKYHKIMKINRLLITVLLFITSLTSFSQECMIGEVRMFAGNFAPRNWAFCDGQILVISQNQALFSIIGTIYGGDGSSTFGLPDLRGRSAVHPGHGPGLNNINLGSRGGTEYLTLSTNNLPPHSHTGHIRIADAKGDAFYSNDGYIADSSTVGYQQYTNALTGSKTIQGVQTDNTGGGQQIYKRSPYTGINYIICLFGVYPN